jgi:hypothetical protein
MEAVRLLVPSVERNPPGYLSRMQVRALKIKAIEVSPTIPKGMGMMLQRFLHGPDFSRIIPEEDGYAPFLVSRNYLITHHPEVGGYVIFFERVGLGYASAKEFEQNYTPDEQDKSIMTMRDRMDSFDYYAVVITLDWHGLNKEFQDQAAAEIAKQGHTPKVDPIRLRDAMPVALDIIEKHGLQKECEAIANEQRAGFLAAMKKT